MKELKVVEYIAGYHDYTIGAIEILQDYFNVDWKFSKTNHIYYKDPESGVSMCQSIAVIYNTPNILFKQISIKTVKEYVNRLQKPKTDLNRGDQQTTGRVQCSSSKVAIASGHLEDRTINFRRRSKAQIGKANLSF